MEMQNRAAIEQRTDEVGSFFVLAGAGQIQTLNLNSKEEPPVGVEPTTPALRMRCSAN
jgi:hypothetical protein